MDAEGGAEGQGVVDEADQLPATGFPPKEWELLTLLITRRTLEVVGNLGKTGMDLLKGPGEAIWKTGLQRTGLKICQRLKYSQPPLLQ